VISGVCSDALAPQQHLQHACREAQLHGGAHVLMGLSAISAERCPGSRGIRKKGLVAGSFVVTTDGRSGYEIQAERAVRQGKDVSSQAPPGRRWRFEFFN
jgi:hypothetical protein